MRAVTLHPDVLVATSGLLHCNCTLLRGSAGDSASAGAQAISESFVIDSPILPDELELLPALLEQSGFPRPSGLLATHGDWDHLLARLAFPGTPLGCAGSTVERLSMEGDTIRRELHLFDEALHINRASSLTLEPGSLQALAVPGRCELGGRELELHRADGHTRDGMAIWIDWASVLVAGDYLSALEIPSVGESGLLETYLATLERLRPLIERATYVVPGHGPVLDGARARAVLEEDIAYLTALRKSPASCALPTGRRTRAQHAVHVDNVARAASQPSSSREQ